MVLRVRFHANHDDWRPVKFPPPHPSWCTGYSGVTEGSEAYSTVVAYVDSLDQILEYWPEADSIQIFDRDATIKFSDRFPCPDWYMPSSVLPVIEMVQE
jgi:hypothetical protein